MKLSVRPEAELDVLESSIRYDEASLGLGDLFLDAVQETYDRVEQGPLHYQKRYGDIRLAQTKRFQHGVYFVVNDQGPIVVAVLHLRRDPETWKHRLQSLRDDSAS